MGISKNLPLHPSLKSISSIPSPSGEGVRRTDEEERNGGEEIRMRFLEIPI